MPERAPSDAEFSPEAEEGILALGASLEESPQCSLPVTTKAVHALRCLKSILLAGRPSTQLKLCRMKMSAGFALAVSSFNTLKPSALPRYYDLIRQSAEIQQAPLWLHYHPHHAAEQGEAQSGKSAGHPCRVVRSEPVSRFLVQWPYMPGGQSGHIRDLICSWKVPQEGKGAGGGLPDTCMVTEEEVGVTDSSVSQKFRPHGKLRDHLVQPLILGPRKQKV